MTTPRWILPTVSVVAALAMAVGGGLVGSTFAEHTTHQVTSGTETVPVLAPISVGQPPSDAELADPDGVESRVVAEREVRLLASDPTAIDPELLNLIATLTEAPDPEIELITVGLYGDSDGASGGDDPCAPRDGAYPDDCPDGYHSTVLPLIAQPELGQMARAFPPTSEELGDQLRSEPWCDGLTTSATSVPFGIASTAPGTFTVRYWPSFHPDRVTEVEGIETSADDHQAFTDALETAEDAFDLPTMQHCLTLDGLEPDTAYTAVVSGIDDDGRLSTPNTVRFNSAGAPTHPGAYILPLGDNLVWVSALHPNDQNVEFRAVARTPETVPDCSEVGSDISLIPLTDTHSDATVENQNFQNAPRNFDKKHTVTFAVPEGSTVVVCARWYQAGTSPSWERVQPLFESSAIVQPPDRLNPRVELTSATSYSPTLKSISASVSTTRGQRCGSGSWVAAFGGTNLPKVVCNSTEDTGDASADSRGYFRDRGASSDLVVRLATTFNDENVTQLSALIPGVDAGCRGGCALPRDAFYNLVVYSIHGEIAGLVTLMVSWEQGEQNGRSDWNITPTLDVAPEYVMPDEVQFDKTQRWSFGEPQYIGHAGVSAPAPFVAGSFTLTVDRPVDYTVRFTESASRTQAMSCNPDHSGSPLTATGHTDDSTVIVMPGLCLGSTYFPEIELVDAEGHIATWSLQDRAHYAGGQSLVAVPGIVARVTLDLFSSTSRKSAVRWFDLRVGPDGFTAGGHQVDSCTESGTLSFAKTRDIELGSTVTIFVRAALQEFGFGSDTDCPHYNGEMRTGSIQVSVPIGDLFAPGGATLTATGEGGLPMELTVRAVNPAD